MQFKAAQSGLFFAENKPIGIDSSLWSAWVILGCQVLGDLKYSVAV